jgi:hypothetical protein
MEFWRVGRPVVADLHFVGEEQDTGPDQGGERRIRIEVKSRIRMRIRVAPWIGIRIKVMRIRNTASQVRILHLSLIEKSHDS